MSTHQAIVEDRLDEDVDTIRRNSGVASTLWGRAYSAIEAVTWVEKGELALNELVVKLHVGHQKELFLDGLKKLGIDGDPPAVAAAKYHYLSNMIGGLDLEYIEESPRKVWIRYKTPLWTFAGVAMLAMPPRMRRKVFSAWHPRNGEYLDCPGLQWVATKFSMEGDPYDEGYFIEHDNPVHADEKVVFETAAKTPEFDPAKAPTLDPVIWPEARILKARAKFSEGYVQAATDTLLSMFGEVDTAYMLGRVARGLAIQYLPQLRDELGSQGSDLTSVIDFWSKLLTATRQTFEVEQTSSDSYQIRLSSFRPYKGASEEIRKAWFNFQILGTRLMNGHISISRTPVPGSEADCGEIWHFRDEGRWLW